MADAEKGASIETLARLLLSTEMADPGELIGVMDAAE